MLATDLTSGLIMFIIKLQHEINYSLNKNQSEVVCKLVATFFLLCLRSAEVRRALTA